MLLAQSKRRKSRASLLALELLKPSSTTLWFPNISLGIFSNPQQIVKSSIGLKNEIEMFAELLFFF